MRLYLLMKNYIKSFTILTKFNKHLIVVGSARSGTSWLSELLAQPYRYRMLFEPEQETRTKKGYLICDKWLAKPEDSHEAYIYLKSVFRNRVDCDWIAQNSNRKYKRHLWPFIPKKYIIKFVRCNLAAHYMHNTFKIPIIHIIRNPYDVIRSQMQVQFPWLFDLSHFANQEKLRQLIFNEYDYDISNYDTLSDIEVLTLRWCIENVIPLEFFGSYSKKASVLRYEDLVNNLDMFYEICNAFNLEPADDLEHIFKKPSSKTHPQSTIMNNQEKPKSLMSVDYVAINSILDVFKTKLYTRIITER